MKQKQQTKQPINQKPKGKPSNKGKKVTKKQLKSQNLATDSATIYSIINSSEQNKKKLQLKREKQQLFMQKQAEIKEQEVVKSDISDVILGLGSI
jgi:hypothetical protein